MRKLLLSLVACATLGMSLNASASDHTVTLGYAQSKADDVWLKGINAKYRYEWDSPVSFITSITYMGKNIDGRINYPGGNRPYEKWHNRDRNFSLSAGPAYRFNDFLSLYGLAGINVNKFRGNSTTYPFSGDRKQKHQRDLSSNTPMYGAGIQINPINSVTIDFGYEGSTLKFGDNHKRTPINGFNAGVGYRF
ncbi:Ail/Lom family outer membrane beta-barrel protein [Sodalis sp. RH21]|uniref:Ail/Lom family outer membrane beta-barrel protein n=1 Tax=unclassified Sodalis (in: enterobacteria) TaxID=2636512 RepID=UPI0039B6E73B